MQLKKYLNDLYAKHTRNMQNEPLNRNLEMDLEKLSIAEPNVSRPDKEMNKTQEVNCFNSTNYSPNHYNFQSLVGYQLQHPWISSKY